jgi:hypothetical protein
MGASDTAGIMANLAAQGVEVTSVEVKGVETSTPLSTTPSAPSAPLTPNSKAAASAGMASGVPVGQERSYVSVPLPNANGGTGSATGAGTAAGSFAKQEDGYAARSTTRRVQGPQATSSIILG